MSNPEIPKPRRTKAGIRYSNLGQAPVQQVDVHAGLEGTLVILRHRLKQGVEVVRDYAPDLPRLEVRAGELNQVWTNLVDNALEAMGDRGRLVLRTYARPGHVVVEVIDDSLDSIHKDSAFFVNELVLPPAVRERLVKGRVYLWTVTARDKDSNLLTSGSASFVVE